MNILTVKNIFKEFPGVKALQDVSFAVAKGEVVSVVGPSGGGKTTLLRCLGFLEKFEAGQIIIDEADIITPRSTERDKNAARRKIGLVFQDFNLWPHKTALENVAEALMDVKRLDKTEAFSHASAWLKKVDLADKEDAYPDSLSGGQKQRVAIARTLAMQPKIVLFDEVTAALDPLLAAEVLRIIKRLALEGTTMLVVTHHLEFAKEISDRIIVLEKGKLIEQGAVAEIFGNPKEQATKDLFAKIRNSPASPTTPHSSPG